MDKKTEAMIVGGVLAAVVVAYLVKKGAGVVTQTAQALNPFNNNNVINQGATSLYQTVTGSNGTIGTDLYDATHDGALDVTSPNNAIYRNVASGDGWSLGTKIYDWFH